MAYWFILNGNELPIHCLAIAMQCIHDIFCGAYLQSLNVLNFQRGHIIIEMAIVLSEKIWGNFPL